MEIVYPQLKGIKDAYLKLNKTLYGLKQSPIEWYSNVETAFKKFGFKKSNADPNLFIGDGVFILLFVNNMLFIGKRREVNIIKAKILKEWRRKDLGTIKVFIGF